MTNTPVELPFTWKQLLVMEASTFPALVPFIQWAAQRHGGLPEGNVQIADYDRLKAEYEGITG